MMYKSITEYLEDRLERRFCKLHHLHDVWENPELWEQQKESLAEWLIKKFIDDTENRDYCEYNGWNS